jgi:hypothetical protein
VVVTQPGDVSFGEYDPTAPVAPSPAPETHAPVSEEDDDADEGEVFVRYQAVGDGGPGTVEQEEAAEQQRELAAAGPSFGGWRTGGF